MRYRAARAEHTLIAVDPGKVAGVARFDVQGDRGVLSGAVTAATPAAVLTWAPRDAYFVLEVPERYKTRRATWNGVESLEDFITELELGAQVVARFTPNQWKGNVPKPVHHGRIAKELTELEVHRIPGDDHNMLDAVALGLFAIGRLGRGGVS